MSLIKNKTIQALFVIYLLSNLLLLLNINGIYWDDWVIYNQSSATVQNMLNQLTGNAPLFAYLHLGLSKIGNGVLSYRVATVVVYFLSGLFLYFILLNIKSISKNTAFYITLLFLILPVNSARIALCVFQYGFFLCVFFLAFWLFTKYVNQHERHAEHTLGMTGNRLAILTLFYLSFFVSSLLVYYAIVPLYLIYQKRTSGSSMIDCVKYLLTHYLDFMLLPLLFYYVKTHYFVPYGLYENYNAVTWDYLKNNLVHNLILSTKTALYKPLSYALIISVRFWFLTLLSIAFLFWYLRNKPLDLEKSSEHPLALLAIGFLIFLLAIFPYAAIGKIPVLKYFDSRNMLLVPLGVAVVLYSGILLIAQKKPALARMALITLLASCMIKNMYDQAQYLKDWFYQVAMEEQYKSNTKIKNNSTFLVTANFSFANNRSMQFYEHNGLLKKVFDEEVRFMANDLNEMQTFAYLTRHKQYNFSDWHMKSPVMVSIQKEPGHELTKKPFLSLLYRMLHDEQAFRHDAKQLITMDVV